MFWKHKPTADMSRMELEFLEVFELLADAKKELREIQSIINNIWAKQIAMDKAKNTETIQQELEGKI